MGNRCDADSVFGRERSMGASAKSVSISDRTNIGFAQRRVAVVAAGLDLVPCSDLANQTQITSVDVLPIASAQDVFDRTAFNSKLVGKRLLRDAIRLVCRPNLSNILGGELYVTGAFATGAALGLGARSMRFASSGIQAPLVLAIRSVVSVCARKQVHSIAARRVVTRVAHEIVAGVESVDQKERHSVSGKSSTGRGELAVSALAPSLLPLPASVGKSDINVRPESRNVARREFWQRLRSSVHTVIIHGGNCVCYPFTPFRPITPNAKGLAQWLEKSR